MAALGGNDEGDANTQFDAREAHPQRGGALVRRPRRPPARLPEKLIDIASLSPGKLRADIQILGVRKSAQRGTRPRIIVEVRNILFGTQDRQDYPIVSAPAHYIHGPGAGQLTRPDSSPRVLAEGPPTAPLPTRSPREGERANVPLVPDHDYLWLSDADWRCAQHASSE